MKMRGRISGQTILLDTLPGLPMDQRVEIDITPVEDTTETGEARKDEASARKPAGKRKRGATLSDILSNIGISREELDARIEADPSIREARKHRKKLEQLMGEHKIDVAQLIREDRDR